MFKIVSISIMSFIFISLFTGCVQRELSPSDFHSKSHRNVWGEMTNINDVNISDLDQNLSETELMITEDGEDNKLDRIEFPVSEYAHLARSGKGTIKGSIYVTDGYGKHIAGANTRLYLNPLTSYSQQWFEESYLSGFQMKKADARLFNYLRFTASNSSGDFVFYGVPTGSYYLIGTVKCAQECGYASEKSIRIANLVSVRGNQIVVKDLARMIE